jgi:serine protease DegS
MMSSTARQYALFLAGSVLGAVLVALVLMQLLPDPAPRGARAAPAADLADDDEGPPLPDLLTGSFAPAVRASAPAVVSIYARRLTPATSTGEQRLDAPVRPRYTEGLGSGVIVDDAGHIVTNAHVIQDSEQIRVQLTDGREAAVEVVGSDPDTDLAVLRIELENLPVMRLGRSDRLAVGDVVLAIGNPLGLSQAVTAGIVSATGRAELGVATFEDFIQTDAAINAGNSGGALVNARGELVGINTAVLGRGRNAEGLGIAIPVDMVRGVMREILANGRVIRGWLGMVLEDVADEHARVAGLAHGGVVITNFYPNSPARRAGLARGDLIESIDGVPVRSARDALARIAGRKPGSRITLQATRGDAPLTVELSVMDTPAR